MNEKHICSLCGKEFKDGRKLGGHIISAHEKIFRNKKLEKVIIKKNCLKCNKEFEIEKKIKKNGSFSSKDNGRAYCSRQCANSKAQTEEMNKSRSEKLTIVKEIRFCLICKKELRKRSKSEKCNKCIRESPEHKVTLSKALKGKTGGFRNGGGRGKRGIYQGYYCDSSWELAFVIYNLEHEVKFERNNIGFEYEFEDEKHKYYPDFLMEDGSYVEIKGYYTKQVNAKSEQFKHKLVLIDKNSISKYLDYVIEKYGKDFISLYENKKVICSHK